MMTECASHIVSIIVYEHFGRSGALEVLVQTTLIVIRLLQRAVKPGYTQLSNGNTQGSAKVCVYW